MMCLQDMWTDRWIERLVFPIYSTKLSWGGGGVMWGIKITKWTLALHHITFTQKLFQIGPVKNSC